MGAFQGRIGRRNQSQHPRCQIQIRVAVQRSDHGSHQIAHVDVQEDSMERPLLEEVQNHRWLNPSDYMFKKRERANFTTNRIQKFAAEYHRNRPHMEVDSASFISKLM